MFAINFWYSFVDVFAWSPRRVGWNLTPRLSDLSDRRDRLLRDEFFQHAVIIVMAYSHCHGFEAEKPSFFTIYPQNGTIFFAVWFWPEEPKNGAPARGPVESTTDRVIRNTRAEQVGGILGEPLPVVG